MTASIDITESIALAGIRSWLLSILPSGVEVVRGQTNRVPEPKSPDYAVMIPLFRTRLATNIESYQDIPDAEYRVVCSPCEYRVQVDVHGPNSSDYAQIISTLWRDDSACEYFSDLTISKMLAGGGNLLVSNAGFNIQIDAALNAAPLYADEAKQIPFINGAQQYERRWIVDLNLQINPLITITQQFASSVSLDLINVDVTYPPT